MNRKANHSRPHQKNSPCIYFESGYCRYGKRCRYRHDTFSSDKKSSSQHASDRRRNLKESSKGKICGICFEEVICKKKGANKFGILPNCKHCFCFSCIKMWRNSAHFEDEVTKSCPECRVSSDYVYKNSFWVNSEDKQKFLAARNRKLANINCKYYRKGKGVCWLGSKCLFRHSPQSSCFGHYREPSFSFDEEDDDSYIISLTMLEDCFSDFEYHFEDSGSDDDSDSHYDYYFD